MKKFFKKIHWINNRGKIDWDTILLDIFVVTALGFILSIVYIASHIY